MFFFIFINKQSKNICFVTLRCSNICIKDDIQTIKSGPVIRI